MRNADRVTAALLLAFAVAFSAGAVKNYQWWGAGGPGPAFVPFWLGLVMALLALTMLVRSVREKNPGEAWFPRGEGLRDMLVVLAVTIAYVALLDVTGMVVGTKKWQEDYIKRNLLTPTDWTGDVALKYLDGLHVKYEDAIKGLKASQK